MPAWIFEQQTLQIMAVNDAAVQRYGYSREEFLALTVLDIRPTQEIPKFLHTAVMRPHASVAAERWHHLTRDGTVIEVEVHSREVVFQGREAELVFATVVEDDHGLGAAEATGVGVAEPLTENS